MKTLATMMAAALLLAAGAPTTAVAQSAPPPPNHSQDQGHRPPPPPQEQHRPAPAPNYGRWDARWGARPPAPPRHWGRASDWHRHVRACQLRYRSYNARTDTYVSARGQRLRCRL